jgi:hypothetical protein
MHNTSSEKNPEVYVFPKLIDHIVGLFFSVFCLVWNKLPKGPSQLTEDYSGI